MARFTWSLDFPHVVHKGKHFLAARALLAGRPHDHAHDLVGFFDALDDLVQRFRSPVGHLHGGSGLKRSGLGAFDRVLGLGLDPLDHLADFLCSGPAAVRKLAHFRGDHRKPAAGIPGLGRLDRRVQREEVGLVRDFIDYAPGSC